MASKIPEGGGEGKRGEKEGRDERRGVKEGI